MKKTLVRGALVTLTLGGLGCAAPIDGEVSSETAALQGDGNDGLPGKAKALASPAAQAAAAEVDTYLANRVARDTIRTTISRGKHTVDCVDELQQPSLRALRQQTGQALAALETPPDEPKDLATRLAADGAGGTLRGKQIAGNDCPKGTVPIRRIARDEILRFGSLQKYFMKRPPPSENNYEYGVVRINGDNRGGEANISLWNDYVESSGEHAIAQIWAARGSQNSSHTGTHESVEAGWVKRRGDDAVLFVFATNNDYATPCWNTDCGFVAYSNTGVYLDEGWGTYSTVDGSQYDNNFEFRKSSATGSWFFYLDGVAVGYWPASFFGSDNTGIREKASRFTAGGEVYGLNDGAHSATDMGSGHWPYEGWRKAAYVRNIRYRTTGNVMTVFPSTTVPIVTDRNCYDAAFTASTGTWGSYIYFGGSGLNSSCP